MLTGDLERRERLRVYRTLLVIGAVLVVGWMIWSARASLFPFAIGALIAYLLAPLVNRIQLVFPKKGRLGRANRVLSVLFVYLVVLSLVVLFATTVGSAAVNETLELIDNLPSYAEQIRDESQYWNEWYEDTVPPEVQVQIESNLEEAGAAVGTALQTALFATVGTVQRVIGLIAGLALLPLWLFYVLKDQGRAFDFFYRLWPVGIQGDIREIVKISDRVLGAYIRGQIFLGLVVGFVTWLSLFLFDIPYASALGVVSGIFELIPILGPWLSFIAAAIVVLATDPGKIWIVAIIFLAIQQLENTLLVPKIQGDAVDLNPAIIMVLLVVGAALFGLLGVIVIVPAAAILRDVFVYVYNRLSEEAALPELAGQSEVSEGVPPEYSEREHD